MKKCIRPVLMTAFIAAAIMFGTEIASAGLLSVNLSPVQNTVNKTQNTLNTEQQSINQELINLISAPSNLTATSNVPGKITLTWEDNSNNETGFIIERKLEDGTFLKVTFAAANATSCEQSELSTYPVYPGEKYYYRVKAFNDSVQSAYSNEVSVVVSNNSPPIPPGDLRIEKHFHKIKLTWNDRSNNETRFVVQRKMDGGEFEDIVWRYPDSMEYEDEASNLLGGVRYTYRIMVLNSAGSAYSNTASVMIPTHKPSAPQYFQAVRESPSSIRFNWVDTSDNEDGFAIYRRFYEGSSYSGEPTFTVEPNVTEYTDTGLELDKKYFYYIKSYNLAGFNCTFEQTAMTGPQAPILTATAVNSQEVRLEWIDQSNNITDYQIECKIEGGEYKLLKSFTATDPHVYSDKPVSPGKNYYYRIKCWRVWYDSDYSQEVSVTVPNASLNPGQVSVYVNPQALSKLKIDTQGSSSITQGNAQGTPQSDSGTPITGKSAGKKVISLNIGQTAYRVNDEIHQIDTAPVTREGRTMLPVRYVTEPLGASVAWDEATQKVTVTLGDKVIELWIGKNTAKVNGREVMIDPDNPGIMPVTVPPGRTMLPVRFISENLGCQVEWNPATQEARLIY